MFKFIALLSLVFASHSSAKEINFIQNIKTAASWGSGIVRYDKSGANDSGSLLVENEAGASQTVYFNFNGLKPGVYTFSAMLKGENILPGEYETSAWSFYDAGSGQVDLLRNLHGSFGWSELKKTIKVGKKFQFWLKLTSSGRMWIDNLKLIKTSGAQDKKYRFLKTKATVMQNNKKLAPITSKTESRKPENIFESYEVNKGQYLNFDRDLIEDYYFGNYRYLETTVFNPTKNNYELYAALKDGDSTNYWSQTNFKSAIVPGANKITLDMHQYLGEKGSHRFYRKIKLNDLEKIYFVIDPDNKGMKTNEQFSFSKFKLLPSLYSALPKEILGFDFTSLKNKSIPTYKKVTTLDLYSKNKGFGFIKPNFFKVKKSNSSTTLNDTSISLLSGEYRVDLENGVYEIALNYNSLGYWDIPFWSHQKIYLNDELILERKRGAKDFLDSYFQFENKSIDTKFVWRDYMSSTFKSLRYKFNVTDKKMLFRFDSDKSGLDLNSLHIWKISKNKVAKKYFNTLGLSQKNEFEVVSKSISLKPVKHKKIKYGFIEPDLELFNNKEHKLKKNIKISIAENETHTEIIKFINSSKKNTLSFTGVGTSFYYLKKQLTSFNLNHENYTTVSKILKPLAKGINLKPYEVAYFAMKIDGSAFNESKKSMIMLNISGNKIKLPLSIKKIKRKLPRVKKTVGYLGLDLVSHFYFKDKKKVLKSFGHKLRLSALREIFSRGFTTYSGLPRDTKELNEVLSISKDFGVKAVFTYGKDFPISTQKEYQDYLDLNKKYGITIVKTMSDEAQGYSDKLVEDSSRIKKFKKSYTKVHVGGFSTMDTSKTKKLRDMFDFGFYSNVSKKAISQIKNKSKKWGTYNGSVSPFVNPEYYFGLGLYRLFKSGASGYVDWHLSAVNNYPYFELDGREIDVSMLYPTRSGDVLSNIKFELATNGLNLYRKLMLLEQFSADRGSKLKKEINSWLKGLVSKKTYSLNHSYKPSSKSYKKFKNDMNHYVKFMD